MNSIKSEWDVTSLPVEVHLHVDDTDETTFKCKFCARSFANNFTLEIHQRLHRRGKKLEAQLRREKYLTRMKFLENNLENARVNLFNCEMCGKKFKYEGELKKHVLVHTIDMPFETKPSPEKEPSVEEICGVPGQNTETPDECSADQEHVMETTLTNVGEKVWECALCGEKFEYENQLKKHVIVHAVVKPCELKLRQKNLYKRLAQTGENLLQSGKSFECEADLKKHLVHAVDRSTSQQDNRPTTGTHEDIPKKHPVRIRENILECEVCGRRFNHTGVLKKHLLVHTGEKPFTCQWCNKRFRLKHHLKNHVPVHASEKPYKCQFCEKSFCQKSYLTSHSFLHSGENRFICEHCGKNFRCKNGLNYHLLVHSGDKPFKCEMCEKCFRLEHNLKQHLLVHTMERPFKCDLCEERFVNKRHLHSHSMVHTGVNPFQCHLCEKGFTWKILLNRHLLLHSGEKPFKCDVCRKCFRLQHNLKKHLLTH